MASRGSRIVAVESGGGADRAGARVGDHLLALDGKVVRDVLDVAWQEADGVQVITVRRGERTLALKADGGPLGLRFASSVFDGVRRCRNKCEFCFVRQLPAGLRQSLYVKDDDFRLSLLYGNFITLTNLTDDDMARIIDQRISPLYVSWHASDTDVRRTLFGVARDRGPLRLAELARGGIAMHIQIVLCPRINDGDVLERTLNDLFELGPAIASVGVVPVGRSRAGAAAGTPAPPSADAAGVLITSLKRWQARARKARGSAWVWAADELYLLAGMPLPAARHYEDFPQVGNGVGLARSFLDGLKRGLSGRRVVDSPPLLMLTGEAAAPVVAAAADVLRERRGLAVDVRPLRNVLFSGQVTVTGLLGGGELLAAARRAPKKAHVLVPDVVFEPGGLTLDGIGIDEIAGSAPGRVSVAPVEGEAFARFIDSRGWAAPYVARSAGRRAVGRVASGDAA